MKSEPNITRMDYARTHGWWVRIYRTDEQGQKICHAKHFGDAVNGGRGPALLAARAWRDKTRKALPAPRRRNGRSGNGGVSPGHGYVRRRDLMRRKERHPAMVAWLRIEGRRGKTTSYSVAKWGERKAKRLALEWLEAERAELGRRIRKGRKAV